MCSHGGASRLLLACGQERFPDEFNGFLRNLVLFEPDAQLYLLDGQGTVVASTGEVKCSCRKALKWRWGR